MKPQQKETKEMTMAPMVVMRGELNQLGKRYFGENFKISDLTQNERNEIFNRAGGAFIRYIKSNEELKKDTRDGFVTILKTRAAKGDREAFAAYQKYSKDKRTDAQIKRSERAVNAHIDKIEKQTKAWDLTKAERDDIIKRVLDPKSYTKEDRKAGTSDMIKNKVRDLYREKIKSRIRKGDKVVIQEAATSMLKRIDKQIRQSGSYEKPLSDQEMKAIVVRATHPSKFKGKPTGTQIRDNVANELYKSSAFKKRVIEKTAEAKLDGIIKRYDMPKLYKIRLSQDERKQIISVAGDYRKYGKDFPPEAIDIAVMRELIKILKTKKTNDAGILAATLAGRVRQTQRAMEQKAA